MSRTLKVLFVVGVAGVIAVAAYQRHQNQAMAQLYAEAADLSVFRSSVESQAAVRKLATYRGQRSTDMLLSLALQDNPVVPQVQIEAISALQERDDPRIAPALANLLQPHEGLDVRQSVATALQSLPCKGECIRAILHYLERIWRGEPNYEDRIVHGPGFEDAAASLRKDQQDLYSRLYSVLRREKVETLETLTEVHGIGGVGPSPFALNLLSRLGLQEACPLLLQSERQLKDFSAVFNNAPRQELRAALTSLNCQ